MTDINTCATEGNKAGDEFYAKYKEALDASRNARLDVANQKLDPEFNPKQTDQRAFELTPWEITHFPNGQERKPRYGQIPDYSAPVSGAEPKKSDIGWYIVVETPKKNEHGQLVFDDRIVVRWPLFVRGRGLGDAIEDYKVAEKFVKEAKKQYGISDGWERDGWDSYAGSGAYLVNWVSDNTWGLVPKVAPPTKKSIEEEASYVARHIRHKVTESCMNGGEPSAPSPVELGTEPSEQFKA